MVLRPWRDRHSAHGRKAGDIRSGAQQFPLPGANSRRPELRGIDPVVLHLKVQGLVVHPEEASRLSLVPSCGSKGRADRLSLRLGGAVAEPLGDVMPTPLSRLGVRGFGESGDAKGLYAKHDLDPAGIAASVRKFLNR